MGRLQHLLPNWVTAWGFALTAGGFIGWLVQASFPAASWNASNIAVFVGLGIFAYVGTSVHLLLTRPSDAIARPRVVFFRSEKDGHSIFLVTPAEWLSYRAAYALFVTETDAFERLLGTAQVLNVQENKNVQLLVTQRAPNADAVWSSLDSGSKDHFSKIILKPGAPIDA